LFIKINKNKKMGCGGNSNIRQVELPKELTIYGNILDSQTRSLKVCAEVGGKNFKFNNVDFLKPGQKFNEYLTKNPLGSIPMIEEGNFRIFGGSNIIYIFLCKNSQAIGSKLMPEN
jgi:glutathione S-transferase